VAEITKIIMKDGRVLHGWLWQWHPEEGYMTLMVVKDVNEKICFNDIESATAVERRIPLIERIGEIDLLEKAKEEGWKEE